MTTFSSRFLLLWLVTLSLHFSIEAALPVFLFGDSTLDVGTNNFLQHSTATANFLYNGIDFPFSRHTGRFSNGFNTADQIVRLFGYKKSPSPYFALANESSSFKRRIFHGVNFASGGSGIFNTTGSVAYGEVVPLGTQIQQFSIVEQNIEEILGNPQATTNFFSKSIFLISVGSNDVFDYKRFNGTIGGIPASPPELMQMLLSNYTYHLTSLYNLGARKFGIISMPPLGCCPYVRDRNGGKCMEEANEFAKLFFLQMRILLEQLSIKLPGMTYSLGNSYKMTVNIIQNPLTFGIKETRKACCGNGTFNGATQCDQTTSLCVERQEHLFWDWFHPTEHVSRLAALTLYGGSKGLVTPMNFSRLVQI